ncbi:Stk1 family PASTA domain-containing Ser/Thr kinase [Olsenella sp. DSM 107455]|uniref:non-specific serine/threonine protein kinase n=1 Tax=Thermophilibacter gallinarum TaxID=2779357 RepID=A0ABR9QQG8_9ACTN|nr:Stk1 family PASTA domain-containing Ser/Thr kinase [Thermophilibacter gallinarum]MBE5023320.1 Stk1 family PASTA domain-containing Ser/Thr kinase [Thermophilibacter gallinarum]
MAETKLGGRYQVQDRIGTGGMATVYRGLDEVLGRTVAIKTMLPQYANDPSFAARFKQEAQAAAALQSPYIVSVYDWGKDADTYYIVMEYLRGTDLKTGIRKHGALDCKKVAQIGSQIAQALSVAHKHDIIHRDIKPQNIMVQPDGNIKVMDFGIARAKNSHLTQDNSVLGTAHYVSPEQTQGKELGPTTDIYSLGIVMYEAATGQVPFQGDDAISVALKQVNEQPKPPSQLNPNVDPQLEAIILKCMQKNPADRFQTADELSRTLRDYLAGRMQAVNTATSVLPAAATSKLERGATPMVGGTATMPRVERTGRFRQSATQQAAEAEAERQRKHKRNVILAAAGGIVAAVLVIVALVSLLGSGTAMRNVPNLSNLTVEQAVEAIEKEGFEAGEPQYVYDDNVPEGRVVEQDPEPNRQMPEGSVINFKVSNGPTPVEEVEVPDLRGMTADEAEEELSKHKLLGKRGDDVESDDYEEGEVAEQDLEPGSTANAGDTVTYHVSAGSSQVVVPELSNATESEYTSRLKDLGLVADVRYTSDNSVASGYVIYTTPGMGSTVDKGSTVTVFVSSGREEVKVPNVVGEVATTAQARLEGANFVVNISGPTDGIVIEQSVTGSAPYGATITLTTEAQEPETPSGNGDHGGSIGNGATPEGQ